MPPITPAQFVAKWQNNTQKEMAVAQSHFNDVCALVGHPTPSEADPTGNTFAFESSTAKSSGGFGRADVVYRGRFIWEYKGPKANLDKAYQQLLLYREDLGNPPLLITSDIHTIVLHTNFTNRPKVMYTITLADIADGRGLDLLRRAFYHPHTFEPTETKQSVTKASADSFVRVADALKQHRRLTHEQYTDEELAHFLVRLLFCLFAEDLNLLPRNIFTQIVREQAKSFDDVQELLQTLFDVMRTGGRFGLDKIRYFDGTLFDDVFVPIIPVELGQALLNAAEQDWSSIDPAIFGTLFERIIDESKRSQLGAHYTGQEDIELLVEPILMQPLRAEWEQVRLNCRRYPKKAADSLARFHAQIAATRVLDPACGSGNFLYVALQKLLELQKEVIVFAQNNGYPPLELTVSPQQLYGIEINPYAHELAQITAWIGYLQWRAQNGFEEMADPVLRPLGNIQRMDAILAYDADGRPTEPTWPPAEIIIGNPPFLGGYKLRQELGDQYINDLLKLYDQRLPGSADLVCYWFEKARAMIVDQQQGRVGLLATNSIRGGANREVLKRIKASGDIFMAWDDNPWMLEGAAVRVSLIGFDGGQETTKLFNGLRASVINADLTASVDITTAHPLPENADLSFQGVMKGGGFDIDEPLAQLMLADVNPSGVANHEVIKPIYNGLDLTRRPRHKWVIDFAQMDLETAALYTMPFAYVLEQVKPVRDEQRRKRRRDHWWQFGEPSPGVRRCIQRGPRYAAISAVSKHFALRWLSSDIVPDKALIVFCRDDDYFFGILQSRIHERWALRLGTSLGQGNSPRYTPTSCFETFPFPWPPGQEPLDSPLVQEIATAAQQLNTWREVWLNPPPLSTGVLDPSYQKLLSQRTLTNLYNGLVYYRTHRGPAFDPVAFKKETGGANGRAQIEELHDLHTILDEAVCAAYGWPASILADEEQILTKLLALNQQRAGGYSPYEP